MEEAESTLQKEAATLALGKSGLTPEEIRYIFAGDLLGQTIATSFDFSTLKFRCLVCMEPALRQGNPCHLEQCAWRQRFAENVLTITSSHFASAEKQFRFPLEYGNQRYVGYLDGYRKWCLCIVHPTDSCKNQWNHHRKNCGL